MKFWNEIRKAAMVFSKRWNDEFYTQYADIQKELTA